MKKQITIGGKLGYLNPKNGRYMWAEIIGMDSEFLTMRAELRTIRGTTSPNIWKEETKNAIQWLKTPSPDFKDGRYLIKYKGSNSITY